MLAKIPEHRYATPRELLDELKRAAAEASADSPAETERATVLEAKSQRKTDGSSCAAGSCGRGPRRDLVVAAGVRVNVAVPPEPSRSGEPFKSSPRPVVGEAG